MDTAPGSTSTTARPTIDQLNEAVTGALGSADTSSTQTILNLKRVNQARLSQLTRTAVALKAQYGADNARVVAAEAAVSARQAAVNRISVVHQQVGTLAPQVSATGWALQGRVFSSTLEPAERYTVFLVDATKIFQQQYGFAYTDSTGYFLINYPGDPAGTPSQSPPQLYLEIANANAQPVYLATAAFSPAPGSATYQNVTLPVGEQPIGDPPDPIRGVALPK